MAFYSQINRVNILNGAGSKTPNVRSNFAAGFKEKVSDFSNFIDDFHVLNSERKPKKSKKLIEIQDEDSIENVIKSLEMKENQRKLNNLRTIISCIISNLNEIKTTDVFFF